MTPEMQQQLRIRQLVENWAVYRDAGLWDRFRTVWHDDGVMMATWFQGPFEDFIRVTIEGWNKGVSILHFLGGSAIDVQGTRAIAQTKMTISQRGMVEGCLCDVVCTGRFYDFLKSARAVGAWCIANRFTKKTASTRWTRRPNSNSTKLRWPLSQKAIATWLISKPGLATT